MIRPPAVNITPVHWRGVTRQPEIGSARTARITTPPAMTAWTIEMGANASATMCNSPAPVAIASPMTNARELNSARTLCQGWR